MVIGQQLPDNWNWVKASECIDVRDGTHDSPKPVESGGIPLVTSKNLVNGQIDFKTCTQISIDDHNSISKRSAVDDGDILYAMIGTIGNPVIVKKERDFSIKNVALFKFKDERVLNKYFYHFLNSSFAKQQFKKKARGGTQKFVSLGNIRDLDIPLPPLPEQKRIAAILDKADAIRRKRQQAIELADEFLRSVFLDMFGDPVINSKNYPTFKLGDLCDDVFLGLTSKVDYVDDGSGYPLIRATDIRGGVLSFEKAKYISKEQHKKLTKNHLTKPGDLLVSKSGTLGTCAIVRDTREFSTYESIFTVRPTPHLMTTLFVMYLIKSKSFNKKLLENQVGGAVKHLNLKMFRDFVCPLPPLVDQESFGEIVQRSVDMNQRLLASWNSADEIFNSLSQKAFSGEL